MNTPPAASPVRRFLGALLIAVGGLIAALSGLCSVVFLGALVVDLVRDPASMDSAVWPSLILLLVVGGLPLAIGVGLVFWGRALRRRLP